MNLEIPQFLSRSLEKVSTTHDPFVLLIRHADREHIPSNEFGMECPLTPVGEQRARLLGVALGRRLTSAHSSPLLRCQETVFHIAEGAGRPVAPVSDPALGQPGAFVLDGSSAGPAFLQRGTEQVVRDLIEGRPQRGIRTLDGGSRVLLSALNDSFPSEGCCVCVSHDAVVLPFLHWATRGAFPCDEWLAPLDGCIVLRGPVGLQIVWNGILLGAAPLRQRVMRPSAVR